MRVGWTCFERYIIPDDGVLMHKDLEFEDLIWFLQRETLAEISAIR